MTTVSTRVHGVYFDTLGRVLLVEDANSHRWGFPGGGMEKGEDHADTLRREFFEETGLHIYGNPIYITRQDTAEKCRYFYVVQRVEGDLKLQGNESDIVRAMYFYPSDLSTITTLASGVDDVVTQASASF